MDFWNSIDKALGQIRETKPETFDGVRDILHAHGDPDSVSTKRDDAAFFGGSGGDDTLRSALREAGWGTAWSEASYYYVMVHPNTGELLTYTEGDVERGVTSAAAEEDITRQLDDEVTATHDGRGRILTVSKVN